MKEKNRKKLPLIMLAIISLLYAHTSKATVDGSLQFDQTSVSVDVEDTFDLIVQVDPGTNEVTAASLDISFDPDVLQLDSITRSSAFDTTLSGPTIDNDLGTGAIDVGSLSDPITTTSDVATFSFTALSAATDSAVSIDSSSDAAAGGEYIVATRTGATVTINDGLTPIYRLYNTTNGAYLYTRGTNDRDYVLNKWSDFEFTDGVPAFYASLTEQSGLTPIFRLYNTLNGMYLYTRGEIDRDYVLNKWPEFEFTDGIPAFYAYLTEQSGLTPIYRLYNTTNGAYLYTRGTNDRDYVLNKWSDFEFTDGIPAFYARIN